MTICDVLSRPKFCLLLALVYCFNQLFLITSIVHVAVRLPFPWKGVALISAFLFFLLPGTINFSHNWKVHLIAVVVVWTTLTA
jgi:hypothetical protein